MSTGREGGWHCRPQFSTRRVRLLALRPEGAPSACCPTSLSSRAEGMKAFFRFRVLKVGTQELYRGKAVYLFNHRR